MEACTRAALHGDQIAVPERVLAALLVDANPPPAGSGRRMQVS